jgi:hypothetical protein
MLCSDQAGQYEAERICFGLFSVSGVSIQVGMLLIGEFSQLIK